MVFAVLLIRKAGTAVLFSFISSIITFNVANLDIIGYKKILIFILISLIFEMIFLILKLEIKLLPLDVILGAGISTALFPLILGIFFSFGALKLMYLKVINIILLNFFIGIIGAIVAFLIWYKVKNSKFILRFEYSMF